MTRRAFSLSYHDVVTKGDFETSGNRRAGAEIYKLDRDVFQSHMAAIAGSQVRACTEPWGTGVPVFLTFDDGGASALWIADDLERRGWRGHFFIVTDWMGKAGFAGKGEIRELSDRGHVVGTHSRSHPDRISVLGTEQIRREWSASAGILSDIIGSAVRVASVPGGFYSGDVGRQAVETGLDFIFTSQPVSATAQLNGGLVLGRYSVQRGTTMASVRSYCGLAGPLARWEQALMWKVKGFAKTAGGESYLKMRRMLLSQRHPPRA